MSAIRRAIELCGGPTRLCRSLNVHKTAVYGWIPEPPAERVLAICELTGWAVTPHDLRPDLYPNMLDALPADVQHMVQDDERR